MLPFSNFWFNSNAFIPSSNLSSSTSSAVPPVKNMNQKVAVDAVASSPKDKKAHKSDTEKLRRERINGAIDAMKVILLENKLCNSSTLVRADVAEKALEYIIELQQRNNQLQKEVVELKQTSVSATKYIFELQQRNSELEKEVSEAATSITSKPSASTIPMTPKLSQTQNQTNNFAMNPFAFVQPNLLLNSILFQQQYQNVVRLQMASSSATTTKVPTSSNPSVSTLPSSPTSKCDLESVSGPSGDDEEVDVVGVTDTQNAEEHEHDETFSPETTPKQQPRLNRKRSRRHSFNTTSESASTKNDDSGIFDDDIPSPPKKRSGSFAVTDLLK